MVLTAFIHFKTVLLYGTLCREECLGHCLQHWLPGPSLVSNNLIFRQWLQGNRAAETLPLREIFFVVFMSVKGVGARCEGSRDPASLILCIQLEWGKERIILIKEHGREYNQWKLNSGFVGWCLNNTVCLFPGAYSGRMIMINFSINVKRRLFE